MAPRTSSKRTHTSEEVARAVSLFFAVRRLMRTKIARGKKVDPSTWVQTETMKFIADRGTPRMKDLAEYLSITAPSATSLVGGLVKSGLVTHVADRKDRRTARLMLTVRGKAELKSTMTRGVRILGGLFSALSPAELAAFTAALERLKSKAGAR